MKKLILGGFAIVIILVVMYFVYSFYFAERVSPPDTAEITTNGLDIKVDYSRPFKKGRLIFGPESEGALQPYGKYWRLGANEATKLTINSPISIMGNRLDAGSYSMYAFPDKDLWEVGFNSEADRWGAMEPDYDNEIFRIEVIPQVNESIVEQMTITLEESGAHTAQMVVMWDQVILEIPIDMIE